MDWMLTIPPKRLLLMIYNVTLISVKNDNSKSVCKYISGHRVRIGGTLGIIILAACLFIIFVVNANQTSQERFAWTVNFIQSILQDCFITPIVILVIQYLSVKVFQIPSLGRFEKTKTIVIKMLDTDLKHIMVDLPSLSILMFYRRFLRRNHLKYST